MYKLPKNKKKKPEVKKHLARRVGEEYYSPSGERLFTMGDLDKLIDFERERFAEVLRDGIAEAQRLAEHTNMIANYYIRRHYEGFGRERIKRYSQQMEELMDYVRMHDKDPDTGLSYTDMMDALAEELHIDVSQWADVRKYESLDLKEIV